MKFGYALSLAFALGGAFGVLAVQQPSPALLPSLDLVPDCPHLLMRMRARAIPASGDSANFHKYYGTGGLYDGLKILWHSDGTVDIEWTWNAKPGVPYYGEVDWKGNETELETQVEKCP